MCLIIITRIYMNIYTYIIGCISNTHSFTKINVCPYVRDDLLQESLMGAVQTYGHGPKLGAPIIDVIFYLANTPLQHSTSNRPLGNEWSWYAGPGPYYVFPKQTYYVFPKQTLLAPINPENSSVFDSARPHPFTFRD